MVFGAIMRHLLGLRWLVPLQIGAPDMAFANEQSSFWLVIPAALLLLASFLFRRCYGWMDAVCLSIQMGMGMDLALLFISGCLFYYGQYQHSYDHFKYELRA